MTCEQSNNIINVVAIIAIVGTLAAIVVGSIRNDKIRHNTPEAVAVCKYCGNNH